MQAGKINNPKSYRPKKVVDSENKKNHKIKTKQIRKYQAAVVKIFWLKKKEQVCWLGYRSPQSVTTTTTTTRKRTMEKRERKKEN
jgi:hypothetical protein